MRASRHAVGRPAPNPSRRSAARRARERPHQRARARGAGGIGVGLAMALLTRLILKFTHRRGHKAPEQLTLTIAVAYLTYYFGQLAGAALRSPRRRPARPAAAARAPGPHACHEEAVSFVGPGSPVLYLFQCRLCIGAPLWHQCIAHSANALLHACAYVLMHERMPGTQCSAERVSKVRARQACRA